MHGKYTKSASVRPAVLSLGLFNLIKITVDSLCNAEPEQSVNVSKVLCTAALVLAGACCVAAIALCLLPSGW